MLVLNLKSDHVLNNFWMKNLVLIIFFTSFSIFSQEMTVEKLDQIIKQKADTVQVKGNSWHFILKDRVLICIADKNANRMRIISPIVKKEQLDETLILSSLIANFHTALDVKYAISDDALWSVFTHPLKELTSHQVEDAILQVYNANITFGTIFSSTSLTFPGNTRKSLPKEKKYLENKI